MRGEELAVAAPARPSGRDGVMASPHHHHSGGSGGGGCWKDGLFYTKCDGPSISFPLPLPLSFLSPFLSCEHSTAIVRRARRKDYGVSKCGKGRGSESRFRHFLGRRGLSSHRSSGRTAWADLTSLLGGSETQNTTTGWMSSGLG